MSGITPIGRTPAIDTTPATDSTTATTTTPAAPVRTPGAGRFSVAAALSSTQLVAGLRVSGEAVRYVEERLGQLSPREQETAKRVLLEAGEIDGNAVLSLDEAERVLEPIFGAGGGSVSARLEDARRAVVAEKEREADLRDGVDVIFNRTPGMPGLTDSIVAELQAAVSEAHGRPVDIHMMIFSFTEKDIADEIVSICKSNPNVNVRILTDWSQLAASGANQPPKLAAIAKREGLTNLEVKFKKDQPYKWDAANDRPKYDHAASLGLNHHKGMLVAIDGRPKRLAAGSFNWSPTADTSNFENLVMLDSSATANRAVMRHYEEEFEAMWNDGKVSLTPAEAQRHKRLVTDELERRAGGASVEVKGLDAGAGASLDILDHSAEVDANHAGAESEAALAALLGGGLGATADSRRLAAAVSAERREYGRFTSVDDMVDRIPDVGMLPRRTLDLLEERLVFGDGRLVANECPAEDLVAAGLSRAGAEAIVARRARDGDFETIDDLLGALASDVDRDAARRCLTLETRRVAFSARAPHEPEGDTGFAAVNETKTVPVLGEDGVVRLESATLGAGALDMIRRAKPGETLELATYGLSTSIPEYAALVAAARRGVNVRVVLNEGYNEAPIADLQRIRDQEGVATLDVRVSRRRVMHEKFLVHREGADTFNGSANLSGGASRRNAEDRFFFKNNPAIAKAFEARFEKLWEASQG